MVDVALAENLIYIYEVERRYAVLNYARAGGEWLADGDNLDLIKISAELPGHFGPIFKYLLECLAEDYKYLRGGLSEGKELDIKTYGRIPGAEAVAKARSCFVETRERVETALNKDLPEGSFGKCFIAVDQVLNCYHCYWPVVRECRRGAPRRSKCEIKASKLELWNTSQQLEGSVINKFKREVARERAKV